jgi:hypothetical protein
MRWKGTLLKRLAAIASLALATALPSASAADPLAMPAAEADLKVAFLLNFARFVKWPEPAATNDGPFVVGVLNLEPLREPLSQLARKTVRDRAIRVRHCRSTNDVVDCHILLVNAAEPQDRIAMLAAVAGKPVLTVGEAPEFLAEGGIIRFVLRNDRLRIQMSRSAAAKAGLEPSARLLEVAERIADED